MMAYYCQVTPAGAKGVVSRMRRTALFATPPLVLGSTCTSVLYAAGTNAADAELERRFTSIVRPFVKTYCASCHGGATPEAVLDIEQFSTLESVVRGHAHWALIADKLASKEMPPPEMKQPTQAARQRVIDWIADVQKNEARKNAGDPGMVLARCLSNAEYDNHKMCSLYLSIMDRMGMKLDRFGDAEQRLQQL